MSAMPCKAMIAMRAMIAVLVSVAAGESFPMRKDNSSRQTAPVPQCESVGMDDGEENRPANGPHADVRSANGHSDGLTCHSPPAGEDEDVPEIDIHVSNVVSDFGTRCHLNLRLIAMTGSNVIYKREQGAVFMKVRNPSATASIRSSGRITITGSTSEADGKKSARRVARVLQKMGFNVRMTGFRIVNVLGHVNLPFGIKLVPLTEQYPKVCSYEPELHPGATYYWKEQKATFKLFQTGAVTLTAPNVAAIDAAVQHIYPIVYEFRKEKPVDVNLKRKLAAESAAAAAAPQRKRLKRQTSCDSSSESDDIVPDDFDEEADPLTEEEDAVSTSSSSDSDDDDQ